MAHENIDIVHSNFCIGPQAGTYCTVNTTNTTVVMAVVNSTGSLIRNYTFMPIGTLQQYTGTGSTYKQVVSLIYPGPKNLSSFYSDLPFFTVERVVVGDVSSECIIRKWILDQDSFVLDLEGTYTRSNSGSHYFDCFSMAMETIETSFASPTPANTGVIDVTTTSGLAKYDVLMLGPSTDADNTGAIEYVTINSIVGNDVYITTGEGYVPPKYEYVDTDDIIALKDGYLFSNTGENDDVCKGTLFTLDATNYYNVKDVDSKGMYNGVLASVWSTGYKALSFVKGNNILTIDVNDYEINKSQVMLNIEDDKYTIIPVYDMDINGTDIYLLQHKVLKREDDGDLVLHNWTNYNYYVDTMLPYSSSITIYATASSVLRRDESTTMVAIVRDQFGVGLLGKNVIFYKSGGSGDYFTPIDGQDTTDTNGVASVTYTASPTFHGVAKISVRTDGSYSATGSQYVWDERYIPVYYEYVSESQNVKQIVDLLIESPLISQILDLELYTYIKCHTILTLGTFVKGLLDEDADADVVQLENVVSETGIAQIGSVSNELGVSQNFISRHATSGHKDSVNLDQFVFVDEAIPSFWSEKNTINTSIWIRLRPFAASLNPDTLVFKIREISKYGDTGWREITAEGTITLFDAGGGLNGIEFLWVPVNYFHHSGIVYVNIEVYDMAPVANKIITDYWFKLIPDYKAPYIINEAPDREDFDVAVDTDISFDLIDLGAGVDIDRLELYINGKQVVFSYSAVANGYHVIHSPAVDFIYGVEVEVSVIAFDISNNENILYDSWRFYCVESVAPWFNRSNFKPGLCNRGVYRYNKNISFEVYGIGAGVEVDSIVVNIGGKRRNMIITPIVYRNE